jgi:hypothetical protein
MNSIDHWLKGYLKSDLLIKFHLTSKLAWFRPAIFHIDSKHQIERELEEST